MTTDELKQAEDRYKQSSALAEADRQVRNALILKALADGHTHQWISEAIGLSRGRIAQIALDRSVAL